MHVIINVEKFIEMQTFHYVKLCSFNIIFNFIMVFIYLSVHSIYFVREKKVGRKKKTFFVSLTLPVVVDDNSHRSSSSSIRCSRCIVSLRRRRRLIPHAFHHQFHKVLHLNEKLFATWRTLFEHIPFYTILY